MLNTLVLLVVIYKILFHTTSYDADETKEE